MRLKLAAGCCSGLLVWTLLGLPKELQVESNFAQRLDLMRNLGLHDTRALGRQDVVLWLWPEDAVPERTRDDMDTPPDSRLRRMVSTQCRGDCGLGELCGAAIGNDAGRETLHRVRHAASSCGPNGWRLRWRAQP